MEAEPVSNSVDRGERGESPSLGAFPTPEEIMEYISDPGSQPRVAAFFEANPEYKAIVIDYPEELQAEAERRIKVRANRLYLKRLSAGIDGDEMSDWLTAEKQLAEEVDRLMEGKNAQQNDPVGVS
jgi:hypothetical protein